MKHPHYESVVALVHRLDANPEVRTAVVLDVLAVIADVFEHHVPDFDREQFMWNVVQREE